MAKIVIDIPDLTYESIMKSKVLKDVGADFIRNGTPLPKGHGRLIDASQLLTVTECLKDGTERCYVPYTHIEDAPTIIEADKEMENAISG